MGGERCQEAGRTKAWRALAEFFGIGHHLQAAAAKFLLQEQGLPLDPGP